MDNKSSPIFNADWLQMQKQYVDALSSFMPGQPAIDSGQQYNAVWTEALRHWWQSVESTLPDTTRPVFQNLVGQSEAFYSITGQFAELLKHISTAAPEDWQSVMSSHFGKMKSGFDSMAESGQPASSFAWPTAVDLWKQAAASMSVLPSGLFQQDAGTDVNRFLEPFLSVPSLGPGRALREKIRKATMLWTDYQKNSREYHLAFSQLNKLALDRLETTILDYARDGKKITSLKQIYNLWIDSSEEVFAEFAFNDDYSRLYGRLVDSFMRFRKEAREVTDEMLRLTDLPDSKSMQTLYQRQNCVRREIREVRARELANEAELNRLKAELGTYRKQSGKQVKAKSGKPAPGKSKTSAGVAKKTRRPVRKKGKLKE